MSDALAVEYQPLRGPRRRVRFVETDAGLERRTDEWTGCRWRETGREPIRDVTVER